MRVDLCADRLSKNLMSKNDKEEVQKLLRENKMLPEDEALTGPDFALDVEPEPHKPTELDATPVQLQAKAAKGTRAAVLDSVLQSDQSGTPDNKEQDVAEVLALDASDEGDSNDPQDSPSEVSTVIELSAAKSSMLKPAVPTLASAPDTRTRPAIAKGGDFKRTPREGANNPQGASEKARPPRNGLSKESASSKLKPKRVNSPSSTPRQTEAAVSSDKQANDMADRPVVAFLDKELMVAMADLPVEMNAKAAVTQTLAKAGRKVTKGALLRLLLSEDIDGCKCMQVAYECDSEACGWVVGVNRQGRENLRLAAIGCRPLMQTVKKLVCWESLGATAKKVDDFPAGTLLRVAETRAGQDGVEKARVARKESSPNDPFETVGWIVRTSQKEAGKDNLEMAPTLSLSFDLKEHSAAALSRALERKLTKAPKKKMKPGSAVLPRQEGGKRPQNLADGAQSRHRLAETPASLVLLFNCRNSAFKVTDTDGDLAKLPAERAFDLTSTSGGPRLGQVRIAAQMGMGFLERVEFPDQCTPPFSSTLCRCPPFQIAIQAMLALCVCGRATWR